MPLFLPQYGIPRRRLLSYSNVTWSDANPETYTNVTWEDGVFTQTSPPFTAINPNIEFLFGEGEGVVGNENISIPIGVNKFGGRSFSAAGDTLTYGLRENPGPVRKVVSLVRNNNFSRISSIKGGVTLDSGIIPGTEKDLYVGFSILTYVSISGDYSFSGSPGVTDNAFSPRSSGTLVYQEYHGWDYNSGPRTWFWNSSQRARNILTQINEAEPIKPVPSLIGTNYTFPVPTTPVNFDLKANLLSSFVKDTNVWPAKNNVYKSGPPIQGFWTWTPNSAPSLPASTYNSYLSEQNTISLVPQDPSFQTTTKRLLNFQSADYGSNPLIPRGPETKTAQEYDSLLFNQSRGVVVGLTGTPVFSQS